MTEPRPKQLAGTTADIHAAVEAGREQEDLFKVYRQEWIIVFTSANDGAAGVAECNTIFRRKYEGRVTDDHHRLKSARVLETTSAATVPCHLELLLWNVRGEFKYLVEAKKHAEAGDKIVVRNSRSEFELRDYGKKKLLSPHA